MELTDSPAEAALRAELRAWLSVNPISGEELHQRPGSCPDVKSVRSFSSALHAAGFAGLSWPSKYGGRALPPTFEAVFFEEITRAERADHIGVIGLGMVGPAIMAFGTDHQKDLYLPRILSGDMLFCQGFSEPGAGSDLAALGTTATCSGGHILVNGHKAWSTAAPIADHCLLLARSTPGSTRHHGLICLLVDLHSPGIDVRSVRQLDGGARFGELLFTNVLVPLDAVLGAVGEGWRVAMTTLSHERGTFGARLTAILAREFERLVTLARQVGRDHDPLVRDRIAALWVAVAGLLWVVRRTMGEVALGSMPGSESSIVKLRWAQTYQQLTDLAVELLDDAGSSSGEDGIQQGYWAHQQLRSRGSSIEGGTSEVLRDVIAERVLGLPRAR